MRLATRFGIAILVLLPLAGSRGVAQESDYRIVPGQRIGRFELGRSVETFNLGRNTWQWRGLTREGLPFENAAFFLGPNVALYACKTDDLVYRVVVQRRLDHPETDAEVAKYRTPERIGVGTAENEALGQLGRPAWTDEWTERQGSIEVRIRGHGYTGILVYINQADQRIIHIGVERPGARSACERSVRANPSAAISGVPLPGDARVLSPSPTIPQDLAAFSGRWVGAYDRTLDHVFIVEEITPPSAAFIYAWGTAPQWDILRPGWVRAGGQFVGGELQARLANNAFVTYRRAPNDTLTATYELGGGRSQALMLRLKE